MGVREGGRGERGRREAAEAGRRGWKREEREGDTYDWTPFPAAPLTASRTQRLDSSGDSPLGRSFATHSAEFRAVGDVPSGENKAGIGDEKESCVMALRSR